MAHSLTIVKVAGPDLPLAELQVFFCKQRRA